MNEGDRIVLLLRDLPPELSDPVDRFEQVARKAGRRRTRRFVAVGVGCAVAAMLAAPLGVRLMSSDAPLTPGGAAPPIGSSWVEPEEVPGGQRVTHLSEPRTVEHEGLAVIDLGPEPEGATAVSITLTCLSGGSFRYPDGARLVCNAAEIRDYVASPYVMDLAHITFPMTVEARPGTWRATVSYVSTETTPWGVNAKGETYGVENENGTPDLIGVVATNERTGYAYRSDLAAAHSPLPASPEHALEIQEEQAETTVTVPVYESDGETVIGEFVTVR